MIDFQNIDAKDMEEGEEEKFDFNSPEHVLIEVVGPHDDNPDNKDWNNWSIESCTIIWFANENVTGAASYEQSYCGFLDYTIQGMIDCPGEGWFVVENVTGVYNRGDGWHTDDDMEFHHTGVRPATEEEKALA